MTCPVAIFGLSADPCHKGHLAVSHYVHGLGYRQVWWVITPQNPDKHDALVPFFHRVELAYILTQNKGDWLRIRDFEAGMTVLNERIRTFTLLTHLKRVYPDTPFTFVLGADNWADPNTGIHTWGHYPELLDLASILVLPRKGWNEQIETCDATRTLGHRRDTTPNLGVVKPGCWGVGTDVPEVNLASRTIRAQLEAGETPHGLSQAQLAYIRENGLYRPVS